MRNELVADLADERDEPHGCVPVPRMPPHQQNCIQQRLERVRKLGEVVARLPKAQLAT